MFSLDQAHALGGKIESALLSTEGELLYHLASRLTGRGCIVEIGSFKGRSTVYLGHGSRSGSAAPIHAIDPHYGSDECQRIYGQYNSFEEFQHNIEGAGLTDLVRPHVATSEEVAPGWTEPIELLFIDGAHDYEYVRADWDLWWPHVVEGGYIALHDTDVSCYPGVKRVVEESVFASRQVRDVQFVNSLLICQKTARQTARDRLALRAAHVRRYPDDWKGRLGWGLLPAPVRRVGLKALRSLQRSKD
jgi:predicted O-methyltransferase YrrM